MDNFENKKDSVYALGVLIEKLTRDFCQKWVTSRHLSEQMIEMAGKGKQVFVPGAENHHSTLSVSVKMAGAAQKSLENLIGHCEFFLKNSKRELWPPDDPRVAAWKEKIKAFLKKSPKAPFFGNRDYIILSTEPEEAANQIALLCRRAIAIIEKQTKELKIKQIKNPFQSF